jgi:hypothetical protein
MDNAVNYLWKTVSGFTFFIGMAECFFGYRILNATLGITGFIVGGLLCGGLVYERMGSHPVIALMAGIVGGVIGSLLMLGLFVFGVFILGATLGLMLGEAVSLGIFGSAHLIIMVPIAIVGGIATIIMRKSMIIISTSFIGAYLISFSVGKLIGMPNIIFRFQRFNEIRKFGSQFFVMLLFYILLGIAGTIVQYKYTATSETK